MGEPGRLAGTVALKDRILDEKRSSSATIGCRSLTWRSIFEQLIGGIPECGDLFEIETTAELGRLAVAALPHHPVAVTAPQREPAAVGLRDDIEPEAVAGDRYGVCG